MWFALGFVLGALAAVGTIYGLILLAALNIR